MELESARTLAERFLENQDFVFPQIRTQIEGLRDRPGPGSISWTIPREQPLRTIVSPGSYLPSGRGPGVVGTLSFVWEIERVLPRKRRAPAQHFQLIGLASTVARVYAVNGAGVPATELAMWRVEIGDDTSPGCHFHVQIRGESNDGPFPRSLSVPRLPGCLATPMVALEFLLAELFQKRWMTHVSTESDALKRWRAIQRARLSKLFEWQSTTVSDSETLSPWSALKHAKPPPNIFLT